MKHGVAFAGGVALALGVAPALAQGTTKAETPAQLLEALRAAGYDLSEIATLNEDGTVSVALPEGAGERVGAETEAEGVVAPVAAAPPGEPEVLWDTKLTLGFGYTTGNTQNANFNGSIITVREVVERTKLTMDAAYFYAEDGEEKTENRFTGGLLHDWYLDERWIVFADARYDYDEFKSWRHRVVGHAGFGYHLIKEKEFVLTPRVGVGAAKEFGSDRNEIIPEGLVGLDFVWTISEGHSLRGSSTYYPDLSDIDEFRWVTSLTYNVLIDRADGLSITVGLLDEYESNVDPGTKHNDFKLFGGLTFDF